MAPRGRVSSGRRSPKNSTTSSPPTTKPRRTGLRKRPNKPKNREVSVVSPSIPSPCPSSSDKNLGTESPAGTSGSCSTPKARRFRIPAIKTCPPAPKKQRVASKNCCSQRRRHVAFFAHPDIELFFNLAFRGISVWTVFFLSFNLTVMVSVSSMMTPRILIAAPVDSRDMFSLRTADAKLNGGFQIWVSSVQGRIEQYK